MQHPCSLNNSNSKFCIPIGVLMSQNCQVTLCAVVTKVYVFETARECMTQETSLYHTQFGVVVTGCAKSAKTFSLQLLSFISWHICRLSFSPPPYCCCYTSSSTQAIYSRHFFLYELINNTPTTRDGGGMRYAYKAFFYIDANVKTWPCVVAQIIVTLNAFIWIFGEVF